MTKADDGRAKRMAPWIRTMPLSDQILISGTTLMFEEINGRRDDLPYPIDEVTIREAAVPAESVRVAQLLADQYATAPPYIGADGVDEHWRVSNMAQVVAERIRNHFE